MFIHPEVQNDELYERAKLHRLNPSLSYQKVCDTAHVKMWAENLKMTNHILKELAFCPYERPPVIEDYERELQMQDVLDATLNEFNEEEGF